MKGRYLEITYRKGKAVGAYFYLNKRAGVKSVRTQKFEDGLIADFDNKDHPIGLEIPSPKTTTLSQINHALKQLSLMPVSEDELAPLKVA